MQDYLRVNSDDPRQLAARCAARESCLPNYLYGRPKSAVALPRGVQLAAKFEPLLCQLGAQYAVIDTVFHEDGMAQALTD